MRTQLVATALTLWALVSTAEAADAPSLSFGLRLQGWYMAEEHGAADGGTAQDFLLRRGYLSVTGKLSSSVSAFVHVSGDRIGQTGLDAPGLGLGTGVALRDAWVSWQRLLVEDSDDTSLPAAGLSYLARGHDLKLTADWSRCARGAQPSSNALTLQAQAGF